MLIRFTGEWEVGTELAAAVLERVEVADSWPEATPTMQKHTRMFWNGARYHFAFAPQFGVVLVSDPLDIAVDSRYFHGSKMDATGRNVVRSSAATASAASLLQAERFLTANPTRPR
jgi:hypothetical protein